MRKRDNHEQQIVVSEGSCVIYQYDEGEDALGKVTELYEDADGEPVFKHTCFWTYTDIKKDTDRWRLPQDTKPFQKGCEVVYCGEVLEDPCWLILGRCTVRRVQNTDAGAVDSAVARCQREEDSYFWRYELPHVSDRERLGLLPAEKKQKTEKANLKSLQVDFEKIKSNRKPNHGAIQLQVG